MPAPYRRSIDCVKDVSMDKNSSAALLEKSNFTTQKHAAKVTVCRLRFT